MKFQCQESCGGKCCKVWQDGKASFVFLTKNDRIRLAAFLKKPITDFAIEYDFEWTRFSKEPTKQWVLLPQPGESVPCQFLKDGKCSVYEARPTQCRTFPFWPEFMTDKAWHKLGEHCPGIDKGPHIEKARVQLQLIEQENADASIRSARN